MNKGVKAVELALQLNQLNPAIKPAISLKSGFLQVEIYETYEFECQERIYTSTSMFDDEEAVNAVIRDLQVMLDYTKGAMSDDVRA